MPNLNVTVKDSSGKPVQGAKVCADQAGLGCVTTNANGVAVLTGLTLGQHQVFINGTQCCTHAVPSSIVCTI